MYNIWHCTKYDLVISVGCMNSTLYSTVIFIILNKFVSNIYSDISMENIITSAVVINMCSFLEDCNNSITDVIYCQSLLLHAKDLVFIPWSYKSLFTYTYISRQKINDRSGRPLSASTSLKITPNFLNVCPYYSYIYL